MLAFSLFIMCDKEEHSILKDLLCFLQNDNNQYLIIKIVQIKKTVFF